MKTDDDTAKGDGPQPDNGAEGAKPAARRRSAGKMAGGAVAGGPKAAAKGRAAGRGEGRGAGRGTGQGGGRKAKDAAAAVAVSGDAGSDETGAAETGDASAGAFKTRDLVDRVAKLAGLKRRAAKPLVETVLGELAAALNTGRSLSLRPLGKVTVSRTREAGGGQVIVCRIRQRGPKPAATEFTETPDEALAEVTEGR